jgi:nicotinamide-nucleotide amidase
MNELNRLQAYIPENAHIINNEKGTAPITWFEKNGKVIVSMPGVPSEMEWAMTQILPKLKETFDTEEIIHRNFIVYGYPESTLSIKLADWENALPKFIKLAYLPSVGLVKLRLNAYQTEGVSLSKVLNEEVRKLHSILGRAIIADEDISIENLIANILKEKGLTVATAESCTGGNIARLLTSVAGSSAYFKGSVVAYDNSVKANVLNVSAEDIEEYGAVSLPVVEQMAKGVLDLLETDLAVATSGIAGPDGGTAEKPVGTVCIAVASKNGVKSQQFLFGNQRDRNITRSSVAALVMLKEIID